MLLPYLLTVGMFLIRRVIGSVKKVSEMINRVEDDDGVETENGEGGLQNVSQEV